MRTTFNMPLLCQIRGSLKSGEKNKQHFCSFFSAVIINFVLGQQCWGLLAFDGCGRSSSSYRVRLMYDDAYQLMEPI